MTIATSMRTLAVPSVTNSFLVERLEKLRLLAAKLVPTRRECERFVTLLHPLYLFPDIGNRFSSDPFKDIGETESAKGFRYFVTRRIIPRFNLPCNDFDSRIFGWDPKSALRTMNLKDKHLSVHASSSFHRFWLCLLRAVIFCANNDPTVLRLQFSLGL
jgi:hypothetical protein